MISRTGSHLLIVDDNPGDIHLIEMALEANGMDVSVSTAHDGNEAQEMLDRRAATGDLPDLVLLDLNMPRVGGLQVLQFIADRGIIGLGAVVVMTTSSHPRHRAQCLALGASDFLTKPAEFDDLVTMVKGLGKYFSLPVPVAPPEPASAAPNSLTSEHLADHAGVDRPAVDRREQTAVASILAGGGEASALMRSIAWADTAVGPVSGWSHALRTMVGLMLRNKFPMLLWWGPKYVQFYNDAYVPILGDKHRRSMGQPGPECWPEIWHLIGPMIDATLYSGVATVNDDLAALLHRKGFLEETHFNFAYSPVPDETVVGTGVGGVFVTGAEISEQIFAARQMRMLRELGARLPDMKTPDLVCTVTAETMQGNAVDLPFTLIYQINDDGTKATLCAHGGFAGADDHRLVHTIDVTRPDADGWPFASAMATRQPCVVSDLQRRFAAMPTGPWSTSPHAAMVLPLGVPDQPQVYGILVVGLNPHRALDDGYRSFLDLTAAQLVTALRNVFALREAQRQAEALAKLDRAKIAFFSNISHEFRTPLTLMLGPLEEALTDQSQPLDPRQRERLEVSQRNALRLLKLVNTLLDFSRVEAGRAQAIYRPANLAQATTDLASAFRSLVEKSGLTLCVECPAIADPIYVDHDMWEKIVLNLLSNAFKYTLTGSITVRQQQVGQFAELIVSDTGIGIAPEELPRVFERFHRVANARGRTQEGSGIGLAFVHELVRIHGGTVVVASEVGRGTAFTVSIPVGKVHLPAQHIEGALVATGLAAEPYLAEAYGWLPDEDAGTSDGTLSAVAHELTPEPGTLRSVECVLLVEDNADMRSYLARLLGSRWRVVTAGDGEAALKSALAHPPDLVLSDVMMPGLDGFGLLAALRADERTKAIPVLLLSARAGEEANMEGLRAGADDYIVKPFSARELIARVAASLALCRIRRETSERERQLRDELARSNDELTQFAAVASHDLQEPLRMVTSYLGLLQRKHQAALAPEAIRYIGIASDGASRMSRLVTALLEYAKIGAGSHHFTRVSLTTVATDAIENVQRMISEAGGTIAVTDLPEVDGDLALLTQVLQNLIANAIKYRSPQPPAIRLSATRVDDRWIIAVEDNGIGIAADNFPRLFKVFSRLHADAKIPGAGIGLASCRRIVELHDGRIWVDSVPGEGSTFSFTIPVAQ